MPLHATENVPVETVIGQEDDLPQPDNNIEEQQTKHSVVSVLSQAHGTTVCRTKDALGILLSIALIGGSAYLIQTQADRLIAFSDFVEGLGFVGHLIYFLLFIWVGLPFGYNWSTLIVMVGFSYGWLGLIDNHVGTLLSCILNFFLVRYCCRTGFDRWLRRLGPKKRLYLDAAKHVMEKERAGFCMLVVFREGPLTVGLGNAFLSSWTNISVVRFTITSMLGLERNTIMLTYVGVLIRQMGDAEALFDSSDGRRDMIINISAYVVVLIILSVFCRYIVVRVVPRLISQDAEISASGLPKSSGDQMSEGAQEAAADNGAN